jgi:hypothetical protein
MNLGILAVDLSGAWIGLAMAIGFVLGGFGETIGETTGSWVILASHG